MSISESDEQEQGSNALILQLLGEARALIASLQEQIVKMREQTWDVTRNLDMRLRAQEDLHSKLLYVIAGIGVLGILCNGIGLIVQAIALFRILERLP